MQRLILQRSAHRMPLTSHVNWNFSCKGIRMVITDLYSFPCRWPSKDVNFLFITITFFFIVSCDTLSLPFTFQALLFLSFFASIRKLLLLGAMRHSSAIWSGWVHVERCFLLLYMVSWQAYWRRHYPGWHTSAFVVLSSMFSTFCFESIGWKIGHLMVEAFL